MSLFVACFSSDVTSNESISSLEQIKLSVLVCNRLKKKFSTWVSFRISVSKEDFSLMNTGAWRNGCLIESFYGHLHSLSDLQV
jgi:hypothetical protein